MNNRIPLSWGALCRVLEPRLRPVFAAALILCASSTSVLADGSRDLFPAGYVGARANLDLQTDQIYVGVVRRRTFLYVYAEAGEYLLLGSSNRIDGNTAGNIRVYNPQPFGQPGDETIPAASSFDCVAGPTGGAAGPHFFGDPAGPGNITGAIATREAELAGPRSADNTAGPADAWVPCAYRAPVSGIYGVLFAASDGGGGPNGAISPPARSNNSVAAWEVTVRADAGSTLDLAGRVFTYAFAFFTGANDRLVNSDLYYVTSDGFRYRQVLRDLDPNGYVLYANVSGFLDGTNPLYKNVRGNNAVVFPFVPAGTGITAQPAQYPAFFTDIDPAGPNAARVAQVLSALAIPATPPVATLDSTTFEGALGGSQTVINLGGTFTLVTTNTITFQIVISRDGVDFDPANPLNKTLTGFAPGGTLAVQWDGSDNAANPFPVGTFSYRVEGRNGDVHFPMVDVEGNLGGGPTIERLNGPGTPAERRIVFFDDRGYRTSNGSVVGVLNGTLCPPGSGGQAPSPPVNLLGVDSATVYRAWPGNGNSNLDCVLDTTTQGFGDAKGLDLWTHVATAAINQTIEILGAQADVSVSKDDGLSTVLPGGAIAYTVVVGNAGPSPADGTVLTDPPVANLTVTGVACGAPSGGAVCPGAPALTVANLQGPGIAIPTLPAGGSVTFTIEAVAGSSGRIDNVATVTPPAGVVDPNPDNNSDNDITDIVVPELTITKTATPASFAVGVPASYTLTVQNTGAAATTAAATVTDVILASLTLGAPPAGCSAAGQTVTCTIDPGLAVSASVSFVIPVTPTAAAVPSVQNTATVVGGGDPGCPGLPRCGSTITTPVSAPELTITKTATPASFTVGVAASYTLSVQNTGTAATTDAATVTDVIPASLTLGAPPAGCSAAGQTVTCTIDPGLAVSASVSFVIPVTPTAAAVPSVQNTATVVGGGDPGCPGLPRCGSTITTPVSSPELTIIKTATPASFTVGVAASYTLSVQNTGTAATTEAATVTDVIPASLTLGAPPAGCSAAGQTVTCTIDPGLAVSASVSFVIPVTPTAAAVPSVENTATVVGGGDPGCPGLPRCGSTITTPVSSPELTITKTATPASFTVGVPASYTLAVQNTGTAATTEAATVTDVIPASLTLGTLPAGCSAAAQTVTCTIAAGLAVNDSVSFVIPVTPTAAAVPSVENTATVVGGGDPGCPGLPRCGSTITTPVQGPNVSLAKTANPASGSLVVVGQVITYTLQVQVSDAALTAAFELSDTLGAGLLRGPVTAGAFTCGATEPLVCSLPSGTAVGSYAVTYTVTVQPDAVGSVGNVAAITGNGGDTDPVCSPCTTTHPLSVADLEVIKTVDQSTPAIGAEIVFTLQVRNLGPDPATNVRVLDALPAGFNLIDTTASQGAYAAPLWTVGSLAVGQTETLQMRVQVNGNGPYLNVATVEGDQFDPVPDNNTDGVEPAPPVPPALQRPALVPVDAPWALLALIVLILGMAGLQLHRRD